MYNPSRESARTPLRGATLLTPQNLFLAAALAASALLAPQTVSATIITQSVDSTSDSTIHWMGPIWGSPADYPAAGNDYISDGAVTGTLRTGSAGSGITFAGDTLTLRNGVSFVVKRSATANYIAESGSVFFAAAEGKSINGGILVADGQTAVFNSNARAFTFNAAITGAGGITVQGSGVGETIVTGADNTFSGDWIVESGTLVGLADGALGTDSTLSLTGTGLYALDTGYDHAFATVTIDGTPLASGSYGWSDFGAGQQAHFLTGADLLIVAGATGSEPVTYYQVTNQNGSGNWNTLAHWNTASDGSGSSPTAINATDNFVARHTAWQLRSSGAFGGGSLTLGSNHYLRVGGSGAVQTVPNLITRDTPSIRGGNSLSTLVVDTLRINSDTLELRGYSSTAPTFTITLGTVTGTGDLLTNGPVAGHNRLTILDATSFQGDLNVQTGGTEFLNDLSSGGSLVVADPADITLDHALTFTGLTVGATTYSTGTYSSSALGFAGSGSVTVRDPATWYLTASQTAGEDWTSASTAQWTANANGSGGSAPSINIVDTYVNNVGANILRTPSASSTFLGGTLRLGGSARLQLQGSSSAISTAPVLATTGGVIDAGAGTRNLAADTFTAESGNATVQTASGGVLNLFVYDFKGAGNLSVSGAGQFRPRIDHGNGYTGTITINSGATLSVQTRFGIAGALIVNTGANVILDDHAYVTGLTVAGVAKSAGNYTAASLGWSGAGTISVYARDVDGPPQMFGVNFAGAEFTGFAFWQTNAAMWDYYLGKGLTLVRMPVKWEVIQPNLYGTVTFTQMDQLVALANTRGMKIIWDLHNYNQRKIGGTTYQVGDPQLPYAALADLWTKIADRYKDEPCTYGYDLMNEPHGTVENWAAAAQICVDAMRQVDRKNYIIVEGMSYANAARWVSTSGTLDIKDPVGRLIYSAHSYWDYLSNPFASPAYFGSDGNYQSGDVVRDLNDGVEHATPFVEWLQTRPYAHGNFGEYAIPDNVDSANWNIALGNFLAYLRANNISGTYWAAGNNWTPSPTVCHPQPFPGTDRLQMAVLELYNN